MDRQEHIHFISSGEHIHETYPLLVKGKEITRTFVIVEKKIGTISPKSNVDQLELNEKIQTAIDKVKTKSEEMDILYETIQIDSVTIESIRNAILEIYNKFPDARFSFNISGGTKLHSIGLFVMSLWLSGEVYYTPTKTTLHKLVIPKMQIKELSGNPNYIEILKSLSNSLKTKEKKISKKVTRMDLLNEMQKHYKPVRDIGDKTTKREFSSARLTKLLANMMDWELIEEEFKPGSRKEKIYSITPDGEFALKFFLIQQKKAGSLRAK